MTDDPLTENRSSSADDVIGGVLSRLSTGDFGDDSEEEEDSGSDAATDEEDTAADAEEEEEEEDVSLSLLSDESEGIDEIVGLLEDAETEAAQVKAGKIHAESK